MYLKQKISLNRDLLNAFLSSSLLEEFFKWFILFYAIYQHVELDEPFDGIVYGVAVSLGFATVENIFYLIANGIEHAMARALFPVSSHALFGVIMGFYIGKAKFTEGKKAKWVILSLLFPFILHGSYDLYFNLTRKLVIYYFAFYDLSMVVWIKKG